MSRPLELSICFGRGTNSQKPLSATRHRLDRNRIVGRVHSGIIKTELFQFLVSSIFQFFLFLALLIHQMKVSFSTVLTSEILRCRSPSLGHNKPYPCWLFFKAYQYWDFLAFYSMIENKIGARKYFQTVFFRVNKARFLVFL